jgi:NAD(P)-dependent dehydrogenase (short-subunit alcohol dehydrogenase family)
MTGKGKDRVYVITGATSGIGEALVLALLEEQAAIIGVGRSEERCALVEESLITQFPECRVAYCVADLALQANVRSVARQIEHVLDEWGFEGLDALVNNAGTFSFWQRLTAEGFDIQWAVNHLAPFLLTKELLPRLQRAKQAKVITVSSGSHYETDLRWHDIQLFRRYNPLHAYKQTKLANVLFTFELNRRLGEGSSVRAFAADPGLANTGMGEKTGFIFAKWYWSYRRRKGIPREQSAAGIAKLIFDPKARESNEIYWKHGAPKQPDPRALDPISSERLWQISAQMCALDEER